MNTDERFAEFVIGVADRIAKDCEYLYGWDRDEVAGVVTVAAYERRPFMDVTAAEQLGMAERALREAVNRIFRKERARAIAESDQYFYEPEYVRLFLPYFFAKQDWDKAEGPEDMAGKWKTGDAIDTAVDISRAFPRLKDWQYAVILARHVTCRPTLDGGPDWDLIAEVVGRVSAAAARTAYADATRQLATEMNLARRKRVQDHEGPGARAALSNAQSRALISAGR
ncbi:hypothetical protein [Micromonospora avicenniae]|uniref:hypothetical protein n=1 Tax=Micromonospora avicenniae TaxID=1198245 RepID=UPI0033179B2D